MLVALDWGTSNLRASLLDAAGRVVASRHAAAGVMAVADRRFADALTSLCAEWFDAHPGVPVIASGMIGSRQGWVEAPYLNCPAGLREAAAGLARVSFGGAQVLHIVPGLRCTGADGQVDVMRGEETQLWGVDWPAGGACVLPGTHSKWARIDAGGRVRAFQTHMTGEVYAVMTQHSILGRLMAFGGAFASTAFDDGVRLGLQRPAQLLHTMFAARTAGLVGAREAGALPDFLSGMLIGAEIGGARADAPPIEAVTLLGERTLAERYARALALAGIASQPAPDDATTRGQWRVAVAAGLVSGPDPR